MARAAYTLLLWLLLPWVLARLWWRGRSEPGYREAVGERFGRHARPASRPVIWLHAVSLGETRAAQPLVAMLAERHPDHELLVTQMTATGRAAARALYADAPFGDRVCLAWLPYDYPFAVRGFLRAFRPRLGIVMETEIWFNLVAGCRRERVPLLLANARLSERSARGYALVDGLTREALGAFDAVAAQTADDAARLSALGAPAPVVTGNLKFDVELPQDAPAVAAQLRARIGDRPVLLLASTREGEEAPLVEALAALPPEVLVLVVPRHPNRFDEVMRLMAMGGRSFSRRSDGLPVPAGCRLMLGDSMGEMAAYYLASNVAFIGGSMLPYGGQNLIEACACGVPVILGEHTYNFAQAAEQAVACGAALRVGSAAGVVEAAATVLGNPATARSMGEAGRRFCAEHRGATLRLMQVCSSLLDRNAALR